MGAKSSKSSKEINASDAEATRNDLINGRVIVDVQDINVAVDDPTSPVSQKPSTVEKEVRSRSHAVHHMMELFPETAALPVVSAYMPFMLTDAIFVGHLVTDLDSIAGAIGAAELYGGIPARASEVNSETKFALDYWGLSEPPRIEDLVVSQPNAGICLVDHQQLSQVNKCINPERIVGVIDHHALQNSTIITERPIYMDIRPWGSMSTIIAHTFLVIQKRPRKAVAGMLLCAILSDTLNLLGPTTTQYDKMMVAILCEVCQVTDINALAQRQFRAKSKELASLTAQQLCQGDLKVFTYSTSGFSGTIGFAVIETTNDDVILDRSAELLDALRECKIELKYELMYLAIVNIVEMHSNLLLISSDEEDLAVKAFPASSGSKFPTEVTNNVYYLGSRVSRKNDYIPCISKVINKEHWTMPSTVEITAQ